MTNEKRPDQERCERDVLRPLIARMIELGVIPEPERDYTITWDDMVALEETERDLDRSAAKMEMEMERERERESDK